MSSNIQFRRGQIWYIRDNAKGVGSIQGKSRPYVVVSNDSCNKFSPVIHVAPVTSKIKNDLPTHVKFYNPRTKENSTILCEQTMPKSVPDIENVSEYLYTLSKDVMSDIDRALAAQFGIRCFGADISEFETMLDLIVEQKINQIQEATQSIMDARVSKYVDSLLNKVADASKVPEPEEYQPSSIVLEKIEYAAETLPQQDKDVATPVPQLTIEPQSSKVDDTSIDSTDGTAKSETTNGQESKVTKVDRPKIQRTKRGGIQWTAGLKKQFLLDVDSYDSKHVADTWNLSERSIPSYASKFRKELSDTSHVRKQPVIRTPRNYTRKKIKSESTPIVKVNLKDAPASDILKDYDHMPISSFMEKYQIPTKAKAVEIAAKLRIN